MKKLYKYLLNWLFNWKYIIPVIFLLSSTNLTLSHMNYDQECCGGKDCHPISCDEISQDSSGYHWRNMTFRPDQVKASKDNHCHACHYIELPYCLYIQQTS